MTHFFLANLWAVLIAMMLALYVMLDGFDLGIGVLSLFTKEMRVREIMMKSIGAIWDANETWLVVVGGALFGAFPPVYSTVLNALYIPIMLMLFGLILRAVSFEFRAHSERKTIWEWAFGTGSLAAAMGQGFTLGGLITGIKIGTNGFEGGLWDWFNLLSIFVTIAVTFGYVMMGASYLIAKTTAEVRRFAQLRMTISSVLMFTMIIAITVMMPFVYKNFADKWISQDIKFLMYALGLGVIFAFIMLMVSTRYTKYSRLPFVMSLLIFISAFAGLGTGMYPYIVPPSLTIEGSAASIKTLIFMICGIGPLIPVMLLYNFYMYYVFKGVIEEKEEGQYT
jgi:cytochrome bd ubiquinol oxidase subunit II